MSSHLDPPGATRARRVEIYNRDIEAAESFAKEAGNNGLSVSLHQANVGNPADCQRVVHEILRQYGQMVAALPEDIVQAVIDVIPMHALGTPGDVAEAVRYLVSDETRYLTGALIPVAGGLLMM